MMHISYKFNNIQHRAIWHVSKDTASLRNIAEDVTEVQASDDELEFIRDHINNLPIPKNRVVRWYGDLAKLIVGNLP